MRLSRRGAAARARARALLALLAAGPAAASGAAPPPSVPNAVTCAAICSWSAPGFFPPSRVGDYLPLDGGCPDLENAIAPSEPGDYPVTLTICCVDDPLDCSEKTRVVTVSPTPLLSDGFESGGFALWLVGEGT